MGLQEQQERNSDYGRDAFVKTFFNIFHAIGGVTHHHEQMSCQDYLNSQSVSNKCKPVSTGVFSAEVRGRMNVLLAVSFPGFSRLNLFLSTAFDIEVNQKF